MSTTDQRPTPAPSPEREPESKPKIDLSFTQVVGGALAAMTAAFLGSRLSLAGTVAGAAVASIVAAVAGNLYTASLRTTREKVQTVFRGRVADSELPVTVESAEDTFTWSDAQPAAAQTPAPSEPRRRPQWVSVALGAVAAFALAAAVLTGLELASGHSLSGGSGTTITQVAEHQPAADPTARPSGATTASPAPTASESPEPSPTTSAPGPSATPSAAEPTPSASASTPSSTPSASETASPDAGGSDQAGSGELGSAGGGQG